MDLVVVDCIGDVGELVVVAPEPVTQVRILSAPARVCGLEPANAFENGAAEREVGGRHCQPWKPKAREGIAIDSSDRIEVVAMAQKGDWRKRLGCAALQDVRGTH